MSTKESTFDQDLREIEEDIGKPKVEDFTQYQLNVRRNLILFSFLSIIYKLFDLKIQHNGSFLGITINDLKSDHIEVIFFCIIFYHLFHFAWIVLEHFWYLRIRITGSFNLEHVTVGKFSNKYADYPSDPRQSNLYYWWLEHKKKIEEGGEFEDSFDKIRALLETVDFANAKKGNPDFARMVHQINEKLDEIKKFISDSKRVLSDKRIEFSLNRFDKWFSSYRRMQILRLFLLEIIFPFLLSFPAVYILWPASKSFLCGNFM